MSNRSSALLEDGVDRARHQAGEGDDGDEGGDEEDEPHYAHHLGVTERQSEIPILDFYCRIL